MVFGVEGGRGRVERWMFPAPPWIIKPGLKVAGGESSTMVPAGVCMEDGKWNL